VPGIAAFHSIVRHLRSSSFSLPSPGFVDRLVWPIKCAEDCLNKLNSRGRWKFGGFIGEKINALVDGIRS
jgi:hypothetical protein